MGSYILRIRMPSQEPWFWDDGVPYDEYVLACEISNRGAIAAIIKRLSGRESVIGELSHEEIIDIVWRYSRQANKRLRSGPKKRERR